MWSIKAIKIRAKKFLRPVYWKTLLPIILLSLFFVLFLCLLLIAFVFGVDFPIVVPELTFMKVLSYIGIEGLLAFILWILISIFVKGPFLVGYKRFFLGNLYGEPDSITIKSAFESDEYMANVETMLLTRLYVFLWSLLFIVPGVVKFYTYSMVPYIIAENPRIGHVAAMRMSEQMTYGHKWKMFQLTMSFSWYYLLALLTCGIGLLFVQPFIESCFAQVYQEINFNGD